MIKQNKLKTSIINIIWSFITTQILMNLCSNNDITLSDVLTLKIQQNSNK